MKLKQLQEAKYIGQKIQSTTYGAGEDGPDEFVEKNNSGLTEYFARCLMHGGVSESSFDEVENAFKNGDGWFDSFDTIKAQYDPQYGNKMINAMNEFMSIARGAPIIYSHGIEYDSGFTALSTNNRQTIENAIKVWLEENPEWWEEDGDVHEDFETTLSHMKHTLEHGY